MLTSLVHCVIVKIVQKVDIFHYTIIQIYYAENISPIPKWTHTNYIHSGIFIRICVLDIFKINEICLYSHQIGKKTATVKFTFFDVIWIEIGSKCKSNYWQNWKNFKNVNVFLFWRWWIKHHIQQFQKCCFNYFKSKYMCYKMYVLCSSESLSSHY